MNQQLDQLEGFKSLSPNRQRRRGGKGNAKRAFPSSPMKKTSGTTSVVFKKAKQTKPEGSEGCTCRILKIPSGAVSEKDIIKIFGKMGRIAKVSIYNKSWDVVFEKAEDALKCKQTFDGAKISLDGVDAHASVIKTVIVKNPVKKVVETKKTITVTLKE